MIGVIYARYSSDSQREESIEGQLRECYAFAEKQGISIMDTYIDRALSAKTDNRPAFQQMIKDSTKQKFDLIIVWKLDRFARNRYDSARYKNTLKKNNVKVVSATENISDGSEGILLESVLEGMAEYYSADLSEKVTRGMTENALKCKFNGGTVPIGYVINKEQFFEVDPVKAPYVVEAFRAYADGKTIKEIVEMLNTKGVTTSHGTKITINIVTDMLKNRRYIGEYKFQDIVNPDGIPRIVPQALFDKVQRERAKNKRATARHKAEDDYLLTTKLFCGKCGVYMTGESGTARNGTVHRYYKCNNAKYKHTCDKKTVKKEWIEDIVVKHTHEMMIDDNVIEDIAGIVFRNAKKENPAIQLLKQRLSETENALNNLLRAIEEGIITSTTKQRMIELEQTRDEIKLKLIKEEMKKPTITKEGLVLWLKHIQSMSLETKEHKQRLIDIFVNAVYLYDDKLVITFNYKEASKTVTLKEVNGSIIECSSAPLSLDDCSRDIFLRYVMETKFTKTIQIPVSICDNRGKLSIPSIFSLFMDMATFHAAELGIGMDKLGPKGLFWLTAKTKIKIHRRPAMLEKVDAVTWPQKPNRIRFNRFYTINKNDEVLVEGKTEWAIIDTNSGKLQKAEDIYPDYIKHSEDTVCDTPFERFNPDLTNAENIGTYTVKSTDIDMGNHMNNAAYIRAFFGFISCEELANREPTDIEIIFKSPCFEDEILYVKRIKNDMNFHLAFLHSDNSLASVIKFSY